MAKSAKNNPKQKSASDVAVNVKGNVNTQNSGDNKKSFNPARFVREVRAEMKKVVWPTRREVGIGTIMVLVMVTIMSLFFLVVDQIIAWLIQLLV